MDDTTKNTIISLLGSMNSSMEIAATLVSHNREDKTVRKVDTVAGLLYRLMVPMKDDELSTAVENGSNILNDIQMLEDDGEEEEEEDVIIADTETEESPARLDISRYPCNCEVCSSMRIAILNYSVYEPSDPFSEMVLRAIQKTCQDHQIIIS